jgi:hypothetical protein
MPNLLAHLFLALIVSRLFSVKRKSILLFGSFLPDIKTFVNIPAVPLLGLSGANSIIIPIHTPFGSMLLAVFFASLLPGKEFKTALGLLSIGIASHYLLDASMFPFSGIEHYLLFYPVSWRPVGIAAAGYVNYFTLLAASVLSLVCALKLARTRFKSAKKIVLP